MRRLFRPRWIALHLLVVVAVAVMVALGFWQLRRLDERRDRNELVEAQMALAAEPVGALADPGDDPDGLRFRQVTAAGEYAGETVSVRATQGGAPGGLRYDLLQLDGREAVWVLRGFGDYVEGEGVVAPVADGGVEVEGIAVPIERLPRPSRLALDDVQVDGLLPVVVQAVDAEAPLAPVPLPELDDGPHLSYAVQWFLFAAVAAVGYPLLVRRRLEDEREPR